MLWTPNCHPRDLSRLPGFVRPCQPVLAAMPPEGDWLHELKWDGFRLVARKHGADARLWSRYATPFDFPRIAAALAALPVESATIDGEAVVCRDDGYSDFHALRSRRGRDAVLVAFDLIELDGEDLRGLPLEDRRARLEALLGGCADGLVLSEALDVDGETLFRLACERGLEGIVSKRLGSRYRSGPSPAWVKAKNPAYRR